METVQTNAEQRCAYGHVSSEFCQRHNFRCVWYHYHTPLKGILLDKIGSLENRSQCVLSVSVWRLIRYLTIAPFYVSHLYTNTMRFVGILFVLHHHAV